MPKFIASQPVTPPEAFEALEPRALLAAASVSDLMGGLTTTASGAVASLPPIIVSAGGSSGIAAHTAINLGGFRADARFGNMIGQGFSTVIIDTGINSSHPVFGPDANANGIADRIVFQRDFTSSSPLATDAHGHGSHVASLVAGGGSSFPGVAPGANIIALKVLDNSGAGSFAAIEAALQWCVANAAAYNIASVNLSLGDGGNYTTRAGRFGLADELSALAGMGVIVAAAAGNSYGSFNTPGLAYPAADPNTIAVGATFAANYGPVGFSNSTAYSSAPNVIAPFSQRSSNMDIFAPGAFLSGAAKSGSGFVSMAGTSMASPIIAGAAVLAQQVAIQFLGRRLSVSEFRQVLTTTAAVIQDGDDENDNVVNTNASYKRLDMLAMASAIAAMGEPANPSPPANPPADPPPAGNPDINDAPTLTGVDPIAVNQRGQRIVFSHAVLDAAANAFDADGDTLSYTLTVKRGVGMLNGQRIRGEVLITPGTNFTWTSPVRSGTVTAFSIKAVDPSGAQSQAQNVQVRFNVRSARARDAELASDQGTQPKVELKLSLSAFAQASSQPADFSHLSSVVLGADRFFA